VRNLFAFIRRYAILLFFLLLEIISFSLLFRYNRFHQAAYMDVAGEWTGRMEERVQGWRTYFSLKKENEALQKRVNELQNQLSQNFQSPDTSAGFQHLDTLKADSVLQYRKYLYREATVVNNSVHLPNNFITLHRGRLQQARPGMVVIGPSGAIGTILDVSDNFSTVMSILHRQSRVSAKLKKTGEMGRIEWDGADPRILQMKDISKGIKVQQGDTVLTSAYSDFPANIMIGTIQKIIPEKSSNNLLLYIRTATDFSKIQHVFIIENLQKAEQEELENRNQKLK
jgi:rod shape-determining protein MreC